MIAALLLATFGPFLQDVPPPMPPPPDAPKSAVTIVLDVDGEPVAPGRLPKSTSPEARAAWQKLASALAVTGGTRTPITGFDLGLNLRLRMQSNNEFPSARYAYLAPGYLLADTGRGRRQVRGPKGDWLYDKTQPTERALVRLDVGRENAEDRRQLDEALDVARLFVLLVDAQNVRVIRFVAAANPEAFVPAKLVESAKKLAWFELETPDVRPGVQNKAGARILLGIAADSGLPSLVLADDAAAERRVNPTTSCVALSDWKAFDGWLLPKKILVHLPRIAEAAGAGGTTSRVADGWQAEPSMDLVVLSGSLKAPPDMALFLPPDPTQPPKPK